VPLSTPLGVTRVARHRPSLPLARQWPSLWEASLLRQPSRLPRRRGTGRAFGMDAFDNTTLHLHPLPPSPLVRHWPSLRDDRLRHLCRRRVRSETQHPGVPVGHSFIVHPASHRRGNGRALGRLPLYNIAAAGYGVRPNILVCQLATASSSTLLPIGEVMAEPLGGFPCTTLPPPGTE
jgi:hypothetical protein